MAAGLKYRLKHRIVTPFGTWEANEVKTEEEWRAIAPNGGHLVDLDKNESFARIMDRYAEVREFGGKIHLVVGRNAWDNGFRPLEDCINEEEVIAMKREAIAQLETACREYLEKTA